jgi:hypothetical protein
VTSNSGVTFLPTMPRTPLTPRSWRSKAVRLRKAARKDGVTVPVTAFDIAGDRIQHVWAVLNPDKLRPWTAH